MKPPGRRYRSYRYDLKHRKKVVPTPARKRLDFQNEVGHYLFAGRVALSLGFLFCTRVAVADAQDGALPGAMGFGVLASTCLLLAVFLRVEQS